MSDQSKSTTPADFAPAGGLDRPRVGMKLRCQTAALTVTGILPNGDVLMDATSPYPRKKPRPPTKLHTPRADWLRYVKEGKIWRSNAAMSDRAGSAGQNVK